MRKFLNEEGPVQTLALPPDRGPLVMGGMLTWRKVIHGYGGPPILNGVTLEVRPSERICLVGRNGTGKSTLLKIFAGAVVPDEGEREALPGIRVADLPQEIEEVSGQRVQEIWTRACEEGEPGVAEWEVERRISDLTRGLGIDPSTEYTTLSSGQKRRALLGRALIQQPDLLILDEPTNHLDLDTIRWLEEYLPGLRSAVLFVTHDRWFAETISTAIADLDRGVLTRWDCSYPEYLKRKEAWLEAEEKNQREFDRKLAQEEEWIRQGIKARRTRNEGRVRALQALRRERAERRERTGTVRFDIGEASRSGQKVMTIEELGYAWSERPVIRGFNHIIQRGDRIGLIGPNGAGKSTLLGLLLGQLSPQSGKIIPGSGLEIAYFDQMRERLRPDLSVLENLTDGRDSIVLQGRTVHAMTYLRDFLFTPDRARAPIHQLSGGEKNRLLLARILARPCNFLILDEPTNDLDQETLELLQERLASFSGTLLVVSHDRAFLAETVTELWILDGSGEIRVVTGDIEGALRNYSSPTRPGKGQSGQTTDKSGTPPPRKGERSRPRKFLNVERRELDQIPGEIEQLEAELEEWGTKMSDPKVVANPTSVAEGRQEISRLEELLEVKFARWEELEQKRREIEG